MTNALYIVPSEELSADDLADLFASECQLPALPYVRRNLAKYLQQGFDSLLIAEAITRTAMAPKPSWYYLQAILRNCQACNIWSYNDFISKNHRPGKREKQTPFHQYTQREYTEEELLSVSDDLIEEARKQRILG